MIPGAIGHNGDMTDPALAPRNAFVGVLVVWATAFLATVVIGIFVPEEWRVPWLLVGFGGVVLLSFAVQLWYGRTQGFIFRVAGSVIGALLLMGIISVGFGLAALIPT
ncbi:hypothetical protein CVS54_02817 [Microbacterium oxydans]|uniref:Uncharacterized protein n=2 Tax=Microbacteriaceae TaxID=85023 RepID=A0A3S9WMZ5_9MICO|nr:hypothetical protein CVS54_02817 [Microbacterium oxydans]